MFNPDGKSGATERRGPDGSTPAGQGHFDDCIHGGSPKSFAVTDRAQGRLRNVGPSPWLVMSRIEDWQAASTLKGIASRSNRS